MPHLFIYTSLRIAIMARLETITGDLKTAYRQIVPGTMQTSAQLTVARIKYPSLLEKNFYVADGSVYTVLSGRPVLVSTSEHHNPVLNNLEVACAQLIKTGNYRVSDADTLKALRASDTVIIDLTALRLSSLAPTYPNLSYLAIPTSRYDQLNPTERMLAETKFGKGQAFVDVMAMLDFAGIKKTEIYLPDPDYILKETAQGSVGQASRLLGFKSGSSFFAVLHEVYCREYVRGVRRARKLFSKKIN